MTNWRFDVSEAPRGTYTEYTRFLRGKTVYMKVYSAPRVILAVRGPTGQETVLNSRWLEPINKEGDRWEGISKKDTVVAWQPYPEFPT